MAENGVTIKRSVSMPVKPKYLDEVKALQRSDEKEELFCSHNIHHMGEIEEQEEDSVGGGASHRHSPHYETHNDVPQKGEHDDDKQLDVPYSYNEKGDASPHHHYNEPNNHSVMQSPCVYDKATEFKFPSSDRLITSDGDQNVRFGNVPERQWHYLKDLVTTAVEWKWRYTITLFISGYFAVWYFCTVIWYLIAFAHGDLSFNETTGERLNDDMQSCVKGADTFTGMFIFTMETHTSIGFGERYPTDECPEGVFFYAAQLVLYIGVEGMLVSIIYAKIARPARKIARPKFSKRAVVCLRDGKHCLVIRVCDRQEQQTIGTKVTVYLLQNKSTTEGEIIRKDPIKLKLEDSCEQGILWPTTICHAIDRKSPFYNFTAADFHTREFEIVVSCTGTSASTGQFTECLSSYLPNEIYWGERFTNIIHYDRKRGSYVVDYDSFDKTVSVGMPVYSAQQIHDIWKSLRKKKAPISN